MNNLERKKQLLRAENRHAARILGIMDSAITEIDITDSYNIDLESEITRRVIYKQVRKLNEEIYRLGVRHAMDEMKKVRGAAEDYFYTGTTDYILAKMTEHTIENLAIIAEDMKPILESTLLEGYRLGEGIPKLAGRIQAVWDENRSRVTNYARTMTNEIYNQAHIYGYREMGGVDAIQFLAAIDDRTSEICRMLHLTIWALNDPEIQKPPLHFRCRSTIVAFFGKLPGARDYSTRYDGQSYTQDEVNQNMKRIEIFRDKYWKVPELTV